MYAQEKAECLGLTGWNRNCDDGSVETVAEGGEELLKEFVEWHYHGAPPAQVNSVKINYSNATGEFRSFDVTG
jgi:acylphosphatase